MLHSLPPKLASQQQPCNFLACLAASPVVKCSAPSVQPLCLPCIALANIALPLKFLIDVAILQMIANPVSNVKTVRDLPFPHVLPLKSTPHHGDTKPAGYDGPGERLRHVFDRAMIAGKAKA